MPIPAGSPAGNLDSFGYPASTLTATPLVNGATIFIVQGGPIILCEIASMCQTANDASATTLQWSFTGNESGQAATTITGASASLTSFAAGGMVYCNFAAFVTAPQLATTGIVMSDNNGVIVPPGLVTMVIGSGPTTGTWQHYMRWQPLSGNAQVLPAF